LEEFDTRRFVVSHAAKRSGVDGTALHFVLYLTTNILSITYKEF